MALLPISKKSRRVGFYIFIFWLLVQFTFKSQDSSSIEEKAEQGHTENTGIKEINKETNNGKPADDGFKLSESGSPVLPADQEEQIWNDFKPKGKNKDDNNNKAAPTNLTSQDKNNNNQSNNNGISVPNSSTTPPLNQTQTHSPDKSTPQVEPTRLYIAGDSIAAKSATGWGEFLQSFFDPNLVEVRNVAQSGHSTRHYINTGNWQRVVDILQPEDYVFVQFGRNDVLSLQLPNPYQGVLPGVGNENVTMFNNYTKKMEVVQTYGWYLRKMVADVKAAGANIVLLSSTPYNANWLSPNKINRPAFWAQAVPDVSNNTNVPFLDHKNILFDEFDKLGQNKTNLLFKDQSHTTPEGSEFYASLVAAGIKCLQLNHLIKGLSEKGKQIPLKCGGSFGSKPTTVTTSR